MQHVGGLHLRIGRLQSLPSKPKQEIPNEGSTNISHLASLSKHVLGIEKAAQQLSESKDRLVAKSIATESYVEKFTAFQSLDQTNRINFADKNLKEEQFNFLSVRNRRSTRNPNLTFQSQTKPVLGYKEIFGLSLSKVDTNQSPLI